MLKNIMKIIHIIGNITPNILFLLSCYFLWNKQFLFNYYLIGFFINILLNFIFKGIIQQPRPSEDIKLFKIAINNGKRMGFDVYGMPSGHAQMSFFSTAFIYLALKNTKITLICLLLSFICLYQRIEYKNHTVLQVIVGSIVGSMFASLFFYLSTQKIKGKLFSKSDDSYIE